MANLIIKENGVARTRPAVNGEEITVKTPCSCSDVTGVQINGVAFPFYDALGNSLAGVTGLFAKNSLIRVLIDTDNTRAYILNRGVTAADVGAIPFETLSSSSYDMDAILKSGAHHKVYNTNSAVKGTPYAYGKVTLLRALIYSYASSENFGFQIAYCSGRVTPFVRCMSDGNIGEWSQLYGEGFKPTPADIGAAASGHKHAAGDITSGTLGVARGGTGKSSITAGNFLVGNGTSAMTEKTPAEVLSAIGAEPAITTLPVSKGGTGATTFTSGRALIGAGTGAVSTRAITNSTAATTAISASTNLITSNTLRYALNRTTGPGTADTNYTTSMMRAISASTTDLTAGTTDLTSGAIRLVYE